MRPPHLNSVFLDNRFTVRDENERDGPVVAKSDDFTSEEATLSATRELERLISSRTVCRIITSVAKWCTKMAVLKTTCRTCEHGSRERTGDDPQN